MTKDEYDTEEKEVVWSQSIEIRHGPVIFGDGGVRIGLASVKTDFLFPPYPADQRTIELPDQLSISTDSVFQFNGVIATNISIPAGRYHYEEDNKHLSIEFAGLDSVSSFDLSDGHAVAFIPLPKISITGASTTGQTYEINLSGLVLDMDVTMVSEYLWIGRTEFRMDDFSVYSEQNGESSTFVWQGFEWHDLLSKGEKEGAVDDKNYMATERLKIIVEKDGINFDLANFIAESETKNISIEAHSKFIEYSERAQSAINSVESSAESMQDPAEMLELILSASETMINAGLIWNIDKLEFDTNYGNASYHHTASIMPLAEKVENAHDLSIESVRNLMLNANLEMDQTLALSIAGLAAKNSIAAETYANLSDIEKTETSKLVLQKFVDQGLIVTGERYSVAAKIENGILLIGDTPVFNLMDAIQNQ